MNVPSLCREKIYGSFLELWSDMGIKDSTIDQMKAMVLCRVTWDNAVMAERERCVKLCEKMGDIEYETKMALAEAIRKGA